MTNTSLQHHGVLGMRWGFRKCRRTGKHRPTREVKAEAKARKRENRTRAETERVRRDGGILVLDNDGNVLSMNHFEYGKRASHRIYQRMDRGQTLDQARKTEDWQQAIKTGSAMVAACSLLVLPDIIRRR